MKIDARTQKIFDGRIKQVFVYITSRCQLRCKQCLYKPLLDNKSTDIPYPVLMELLSLFYSYGARKLSFLGGEPTLYHDIENDKYFGDVIMQSKALGYQLIRADTNGQMETEFLQGTGISLLDEITFSLDGHNAELNDAVRGKGTYINCIKNISEAVRLGYNVQITSCVHKKTCPTVEEGVRNIHEMILYAQSIGVHSINFHPIIKVGIARDGWIENSDIDPYIWIEIYKQIFENVKNKAYQINVRLPMRFAERESVLKNREAFYYCPVSAGERALIMPDGQIKICAFTIGTERCVARYTNESIAYELFDNEIFDHDCPSDCVCHHQTAPDGLTALCMSFKPHQNEFVWNALQEEKRKGLAGK